MKLFSKFLSSFLAVILVLLTVFGFSLYQFLNNYQRDQFVEKTQYVGEIVISQSLSLSEKTQETSLNTEQLNQIAIALKQEHVDLIVYDQNNQMILPLDGATSESKKLNPDAAKAIEKRNTVYNYFAKNEEGNTILHSYFPILSNDNQKVGTILLLSNYSSKNINLQDILIPQTVISAAIGLLASFVIALILSRNFSQRINQLSSATRKITKNDYNVQNIDVGSDEIGSLGKDIKTLSQTLSDNQEEFQKQNMIRNEIIANASHEMRTPLTTIIGVTEGLQSGVIDAANTEKSYQLIENESNRLLRMVEDNLKFERIRGTKSQLKNQKFNLYDLLLSLTKQLNAKAKRNNNELILTGDTKSELIADKDRITQLFLNIINNAIQFTKDGQIKIEVLAKNKNEFQITVSDNGIGMTKQETKNIFDRFYKVDNLRTIKTGESGLGMAIVKEIIDQHGGQIEINSKKGKGTSVVVTLSNQKISVK